METAKHRIINALLRQPAGVACRLRIFRLRILGAKIGKRCWLRDIWVPRNPWDIVLEDGVALDRHVTLVTTGKPTGEPRIHIGAGTYVNRHAIFDAHESIRVGPRCMIGPSCYITDADHSFFSGKPVAQQPMLRAPVTIEEGVWLGAGVKVLKGVTIGAGSVIGAGAVVTRSIPPDSVAIGVPARVTGRRPEPPPIS